MSQPPPCHRPWSVFHCAPTVLCISVLPCTGLAATLLDRMFPYVHLQASISDDLFRTRAMRCDPSYQVAFRSAVRDRFFLNSPVVITASLLIIFPTGIFVSFISISIPATWRSARRTINRDHGLQSLHLHQHSCVSGGICVREYNIIRVFKDENIVLQLKKKFLGPLPVTRLPGECSA
jgi:hypothetical protein